MKAKQGRKKKNGKWKIIVDRTARQNLTKDFEYNCRNESNNDAVNISLPNILYPYRMMMMRPFNFALSVWFGASSWLFEWYECVVPCAMNENEVIVQRQNAITLNTLCRWLHNAPATLLSVISTRDFFYLHFCFFHSLQKFGPQQRSYSSVPFFPFFCRSNMGIKILIIFALQYHTHLKWTEKHIW